MSDPTPKQSRLISALREGIALVQMILFKELRDRFGRIRPDLGPPDRARLAGAVINEVFGTPNTDPSFIAFRRSHEPFIEQELLGLADNLPELLPHLTDALRLQTLCDKQEGLPAADTLLIADKLNILVPDRDIPLPSSFMTSVRELGARHQLIVPPAPSTDDGQVIVH